MKSYTDLPQSKVLAEFLPLESADYFHAPDAGVVVTEPYKLKEGDETVITAYKAAVPCWSLAALMDILPNKVEYECKTYFFKLQTDVYSSGEKYYDLGYQGCCYWLEYEDSKDLVDACVNMIVKLKERELL